MDNFELAKALLNRRQASDGAVQTVSTTKTIMGTAVSDSVDGYVDVNFGGESISYGNEQAVTVATTVSVKAGDTVIVTLIGADGTAKNPFVSGVVAGGDRMENQITTMETSVQQNSDSIVALVSAIVSGTADGDVVSSTMIRAYSGGVLVGKVGQSPCCLINADDSSFDIVEVTWSGDVPTVGNKLATFTDSLLALGEQQYGAVASFIYLFARHAWLGAQAGTFAEFKTDSLIPSMRFGVGYQDYYGVSPTFEITQAMDGGGHIVHEAGFNNFSQLSFYHDARADCIYTFDMSRVIKSLKITAPDYSNAQTVHTASNVTSGSYTVQGDGWLSVHFSQNAASSNQQSYLVNVNNAAVCRQVYPKPSASTWANYIPEPIIVSKGDVITYTCSLGTNIEILHIPFFTT